MNGLPKLSVVVPMYNEEGTVVSTIERIEEVLMNAVPRWELILVNDGSTDGTLNTAHRASQGKDNIRIVSYTINRGRGRALREGFKQASGEIIVTIECDLSYDPRYIYALYQELCKNPEVDIILGSVYAKGGQAVDVPPRRLALSRYGNKVLAYALGANVSTITSMLRGYRRRVLEALSLESDGKEIHLEILSKAVALNFLIKEVPVVLRGRKTGKSKFKLVNTVTSHLLFSFLEKPMIIFGLLGIILLLAGVAGGIYIIVLWREGRLNPDRPLIIVTALLILTGLQTLFFGFLAIQQSYLRKQIYRLQSENKRQKDLSSEKK